VVSYVWQSNAWPDLRWDSAALMRHLGLTRKAQGALLAVAACYDLGLEAEVLSEDAYYTAAIEGEHLDMSALRSSVARRLGLPSAGMPKVPRDVDGLVAILVDATRNYQAPLTEERLRGWHASLFPTGYSGLRKITVAGWRREREPMQVVSGPMGKERVHFEAPPARRVSVEVRKFLKWFAASRDDLDGLLRAGIAHFRFVTVHPFDDGNGRVARAIADMALSQDEDTGCRLYSMSAQIMKERESYYDILEATQKGDGDITGWLAWFLECLQRAVLHSEEEVNKAADKARIWRDLAPLGLNERQQKVVNKLIDVGPDGFEGGLTNKKYVSMTRTSSQTAMRDLTDLTAKGVLTRNAGGGRSVSYILRWPR